MTTTQRVRAHLLAEGHTDEQGATRTPRPGHCRHCRLALTITISDAGFTIGCWPTPTTPLGELHALVAGRRTFTRHEDRLLYRDDFRITGRSADVVPVLVEHRCGDRPPPVNTRHDQPRALEVARDVPPF